MKISAYKEIIFIDFVNLRLDFTTNYFNEIEFSYNNKVYKWLVLLNEQNIYLKSIDLVTLATPDVVLISQDFNFCFIKEDLSANNNDFNINTIFFKYKLGILKR